MFKQFTRHFAALLLLSLALNTAHAAPISIVDSGTVLLAGGDPWTVTDDQLGNLDFTAASKLVVTIGLKGSDHSNADVEVTYGGVVMTLIASESGTQPAGWTGIFHLDDPAGPGDLVVNSKNTGAYSLGVSALVLTGTIDGFGATAAAKTMSTTLTTTSADAFAVAAYTDAGGNTSISAVDSPLTEVLRGGVGSASHASGYLQVPAPATVTPSFSGTSADRSSIVAAEFLPSTPRSPSPAFNLRVIGGAHTLTWTNLLPNTGTDVWIDVWFGTDPGNLTKVIDATLNLTTHNVSVPDLGTYYWRVDSYLDGSATGTPLTGTLLSFIVNDTDGDALPDAWELLHTNPPSGTSLNPGDDLENGGSGDGLTNLQEYELGTDPLDPDSDDDGLLDGVETLTGIWVSASDTGTDPLDNDRDDDGLLDGVETNTGIWVSAADTGTDPHDTDTDKDSLSDLVETNTDVFVDVDDTGTHPLLPDSDADGAGDWYEIVGSFTDPNDPGKKPNIPYPLPVPDGTPGVATKPVKVYIMAGQSNMVGSGRVSGDVPGTLTTMTGINHKFPNLLAPGGGFIQRQDVKYRGVISAIGNGPLKPGFGGGSTSFGPELGFGHVMGWHHDEPVLILKTSYGGRSLGWNFLPPSSGQFTVGADTFAGYGDSPKSWTTGTTPVPAVQYGGHQYDECFHDEADFAPGSNLGATINATDILDNFATEYPEWAAQGFEIAGFVWWQGWNDGSGEGDVYPGRYEQNLVSLIGSLRGYFGSRYPDNISPNTPFVVGTVGFNGWALGEPRLTIANAQLAVDGDTGNYPEFEGNVKTVETRGYWRDFGPQRNEVFHYFNNAETYLLTGDALGRAMLDLQDNDFNLDPDGDGLANGLEAWFGTDPRQFNSGLAIISGTGLITTFTHPQSTSPPGDLTGYYEWSPNLTDWYLSGNGPTGGPVVTFSTTTIGTITTVKAIASEVMGSLFLRAGVSQN